MDREFIHELLRQLATEPNNEQEYNILKYVCINSFTNMSDYQNFFEDIENTDYDYLIENFTIQSVVRDWWDMYLETITDADLRHRINSVFDNEARWLFLNTLREIHYKEIEKILFGFM